MPELDNLVKLKNLIKNVASDYSKHNQKLSVKISLFHAHGATGTKRVADWVEKIDAIDNIDELHQAIIQYMSNKKMGNTNPHSFRTMLLHRLGLDNPDQKMDEKSYNAALKTTSSKFKALFEALIDKLLTYISPTVSTISSESDEESLSNKKKLKSLGTLGNLPMEVITEYIAGVPENDPKSLVNTGFTSHKDKDALSLASKKIAEDLQQANEAKIVSALLRRVMNGEQDAIEMRLKTHRHYLEYLFTKGAATDPAGREFDNITPFEYALWSLDRHMWDMMKKQVEAVGGAEGARLWKEALRQYRGIQNKGVSYTFEGKDIKNEKHYSFDTLINALKTYIDNLKTWTNAQLKQHWSTVIGKAQHDTVAHVRDEYLRADRSFSKPPNDKIPLNQYMKYHRESHPPEFNETTLPRNLDFFNTEEFSFVEWWPKPNSSGTSYFLGQNLGIFRGHLGRNACGYSDFSYSIWNEDTSKDSDALIALRKVRTEEFNLLNDQLLNMHQPEVVLQPRRGPQPE